MGGVIHALVGWARRLHRAVGATLPPLALLLAVAAACGGAPEAVSAPPQPSSQTSVSASTPVSLPATPSAETRQIASPSGESDRLPFMAEEHRESETPSAVGLLARTFGALLLIVGLIAVGAWALKKFGGARFSAASEDAPPLRIVSSVPLGDKRSLAVVRFGSRLLLVASTPQSVTLIAEHEAASAEIDTVIAPTPRSVADLLSDDAPGFSLSNEAPEFAQEMMRAEERIAGMAAPGEAEKRP